VRGRKRGCFTFTQFRGEGPANPRRNPSEQGDATLTAHLPGRPLLFSEPPNLGFCYKITVSVSRAANLISIAEMQYLHSIADGYNGLPAEIHAIFEAIKFQPKLRVRGS
jgi:hypothetical protein